MPRFTIELSLADLKRLQCMARAQRRPPKYQAEWLLMEALAAWERGEAEPHDAMQERPAERGACE